MHHEISGTNLGLAAVLFEKFPGKVLRKFASS